MQSHKLLNLSIRIRNGKDGEDVSIIYADPSFQDVRQIFQNQNKEIISVIFSYLFPSEDIQKEESGIIIKEPEIAPLPEKVDTKKTLFCPDFNTDLSDFFDSYEDLNPTLDTDDGSEQGLESFGLTDGRDTPCQALQTFGQEVAEDLSASDLSSLQSKLEDLQSEVLKPDSIPCINNSVTRKSDEKSTVKLSHRTKRRTTKLTAITCDQCNKTCNTKSELKRHITTVHMGYKYPCTECSEILSSGQSLRRHVRVVHELVLRQSKCDVCDKAFKDNDYLRKHMKIHEDAAKSVVCPECGNVFKNAPSLRTHMRIVHERKNYKRTCEECGKSFPNMHNLRIHAEMVHMKGALLVCQVCGKEVIGKNRLRNHMMTHPKGQKFVSCPQCGKEVAETQIKSHIYEAHKMQAYKYPCEFCNKRFDTKQHIRVHVRKHTGARPFNCRGCGKHFPFLVSVRKHVKIFHNSDYSLVFYDVSKDINNPYIS